ncbi:MAG: TIGR00730 family Rossman fold protein [Bacteroidaceae bacterium]|nr:TIGR00730 family Rossman fold protein [Bacteroidaceae bacterium]MBR3856088.1 TIGR00730 family Rossman fold protein [Bacteroidaceae bacterium]
MADVRTICVYCASSNRVDECYNSAAHKLGALLAREGISLVTGGGSIGLMRAVEDGTLEGGGRAIGVIPQFMVEQGWHHTGLTELRITEDMHTRKQTMAALSDAVIALPGGCGTMEELCEIITWKQLGLYLSPIVILNINGYYDALIAQLQRAIDEHFMGRIHADIWSVATTPEEALEQIRKTPVWDPSIRKYAAL